MFGQIKQARGFRQFLLRGVEKVADEWGLCSASPHNILKLAQGRTLSLAALATGSSFATSETVQRTMAAKLPPLHQTGCANLLHPSSPTGLSGSNPISPGLSRQAPRKGKARRAGTRIGLRKCDRSKINHQHSGEHQWTRH